MKPVIMVLIAVVFGIGIGLSVNVSAEENIIPGWIKSTAEFWVDGQIGDAEFLSALQYLVKEEILVIPDETSSESIVSQTSQKPITSTSNVVESSKENGIYTKLTYELGDPFVNENQKTNQIVSFRYELYNNGNQWLLNPNAEVVCYFSDGDFQYVGKGKIDASVIPFDKFQSLWEFTLWLKNDRQIEKCEILKENYGGGFPNRVIIDSIDFKQPDMSECRGIMTNNNSDDVSFSVNFRGYDSEGYVIKTRTPIMNSDYTLDSGGNQIINGDLNASVQQLEAITSCKVVMFQTK